MEIRTEIINVETIQAIFPLGTTSPTTLEVIIGDANAKIVTTMDSKVAFRKSCLTAGNANLTKCQKLLSSKGKTGNTS